MAHRYDDENYAEARRFGEFMKSQKKGTAYTYFFCPKCLKPNGGMHSDLNALNAYAFKEWGEDPAGKRMKVLWEAYGRGCCF